MPQAISENANGRNSQRKLLVVGDQLFRAQRADRSSVICDLTVVREIESWLIARYPRSSGRRVPILRNRVARSRTSCEGSPRDED